VIGFCVDDHEFTSGLSVAFPPKHFDGAAALCALHPSKELSSFVFFSCCLLFSRNACVFLVAVSTDFAEKCFETNIGAPNEPGLCCSFLTVLFCVEEPLEAGLECNALSKMQRLCRFFSDTTPNAENARSAFECFENGGKLGLEEIDRLHLHGGKGPSY